MPKLTCRFAPPRRKRRGPGTIWLVMPPPWLPALGLKRSALLGTSSPSCRSRVTMSAVAVRRGRNISTLLFTDNTAGEETTAPGGVTDDREGGAGRQRVA